VFDPSNDTAPDLCPVYFGVDFVVYKPTYRHILAAYKIKPMADFTAGLFVIGWSNYPFDGLAENEVGELVAGQEGAKQASAVRGEDLNSAVHVWL